MKVCYIRVSSDEQNEQRQVEAMRQLGVEKVFIEKISGIKSRDERPIFRECMDFVREGDILYVESISRLGRSTIDLLSIVNELHSKKVGFVSLKESWADTTSPQGMMIFTIFAGLAQFEREQIRQRQLEGIAIARQLGKYKGRKQKDLDTEELFRLWKEGKVTATSVCRQLNISRSTFYRRIAPCEK